MIKTDLAETRENAQTPLKRRKLRICLIMDIINAVPPSQYGGRERIVSFLEEGLVKRGHDVTLFASDDSQTTCRLVPFGHRRSKKWWVEWKNTSQLYAKLAWMHRQFDIINCHGRMLYLLPMLPLSIPKIQSYMCPLSHDKLNMALRLARGTLTFVGVSQYVANSAQGIGNWDVVYNGVPLDLYDFRSAPTQPETLLFLGRIHPVKGVHVAIRVAQKTKRKLIIAGSVSKDEIEMSYFRNKIKPHVDGKQIVYVGAVNDAQKKQLFREASALLFPIRWDEPFGIVLIEALSAGVPVIANQRGAVGEILTHGRDGFICQSEEDMVQAVHQIKDIDRAECRRTVETRFSSDYLVDAHEQLYLRLAKP